MVDLMNWKVEEMKLHNEKREIFSNTHYLVEDELTTEEKVSIINKFSDNVFGYFIKMNEDYIKALNNGEIKRVSYGYPTESSKKAWIRRNDSKLVFWDGKTKNNYCTKDFLRMNFTSYGNNLYFGYNVGETEVNKAFHDLCVSLERKEIRYFKDHDEYEIKLTELREKGYVAYFNNHIASCSDGNIYVCDDCGNTRKITLEEINLLLDSYAKVDEYYKEIAKVTNISF